MRKFVDAYRSGGSLCHQLIMGAGKTTVIAPLLALLLGDGNTLVTQVVPNALLEMSRSVMRERFSSLVTKPVYTFVFERKTAVTQELYDKLVRAKATRAIVVSHPTAIKSFVLKFAEVLSHMFFCSHEVAPRQQSRLVNPF